MKGSEILSNESFHEVSGYGHDADDFMKNGIIAGIKFLEENPGLVLTRELKEEGGVKIYPPEYIESPGVRKLRDVVSPKMYGGTGAMYETVVSLVLWWHRNGTEKFLEHLANL